MLEFEPRRQDADWKAAFGNRTLAAIREVPPQELYHFQWHLLRTHGSGHMAASGRPLSSAFARMHGRRVSVPARIILGCFVEWHLRGVAELKEFSSSRSRRAQVTLSVEDAWQGKGIGTALMGEAIRVARTRGIGQLYLTCHILNERTQRIAERFGATIGFEGCECFAEISVRGGCQAVGQ